MVAKLQNSINANSTSPLLPIQGGTGVSSPTAHGILVGEGASAITPIVLTTGELLIGSTGADPVAATLTAGTGISITTGAGSITINSSATTNPITWNTVTTNQTLSANNGYFSNSLTPLTFTLPNSAAVGDTYYIWGILGSWVVAQNASQNIQLFETQTTTGIGGSITSNNSTGGDYIQIVCYATNDSFVANMYAGSATTA